MAAVPVGLEMLGRVDLSHPVDELVALFVDVVADGVYRHLAMAEAAGADHGRAG